MLNRDPIIDELFTMLSAWIKKLGLSSVKGAYVFGSSVNEGGVRFEADKSDLDIVLLVEWEALTLADRLVELAHLRKAKSSIEMSLFQKLGRTDGNSTIVSLVPITLFELEHAIHKDGVDRILKTTRAYDLIAGKSLEGLGGGTTSTPLAQEHRNSLQFVQKKRAEALSVSPNGKGGLRPQPHVDPLPKDLMRHFSVATADLATADVSDLAHGLKEIDRFAAGEDSWSPEMSAFGTWLGVKRGDRGNVDPTIRAEHYLMLVEAIYDRIRAQYPGSVTVAFDPPTAPRVPAVVPNVVPSHRLSSTFTVTLSDKLGGTPDAALRAIRAARANMKACVDQPFELRFEEAADSEALIAAEDDTLGAKSYKRKVRAFERRTLIASRQVRWQKGVELILWYGGTLFRDTEEVIEKACAIAIRNWFSIAATNLVNPGGAYEASHIDLYPKHPMALSFSSSSGPEGLFSRQPLSSLSPTLLAGSFVPNLVSKYLHHLDMSGDEFLTRDRDSIFDVWYWEFSPK